MEVEVLEQFLLDACADPIAKQRAVGNHHSGPPWLGRPLELAHDELQKQKGGFGGLLIIREVPQDALLFFAAKRWIGENNIHPIFIADLPQRKTQTILRINLRIFKAMK